MRARLVLAGGALMLAACTREPEPAGAITADEQRQLNEAAEMLDANSVSADLFEDDNGSVPE